MTDGFDRQVPHDIQAEQCVLGGMLLSQDAIVDVIESLRTGDFYRPAHQIIFDTILDLYGRGEPADAITVAAALTARGEINRVGGAPHLHTLMATVPTAANAGYYARIVREQAVLRGLVEAGTRIAQFGYRTDGADADAVVEQAQKLLDDVSRPQASSTAKSAAELIMPFLDALESGDGQRSLMTGWADLDRLLGGLRPGQLITIGARPGIGKSVMMACLAHHVGVRQNLPVFISTLEMSTNEFLSRLVAIDCKVSLDRLLNPKRLEDPDWVRLGKAQARFSEAENLIIDDEPGAGVGHLRTALRSMRRAGRLPAVAIVDYLQLMRSGMKTESRQVEVSGFSRDLKLLAKEFGLPIVVGAQLNRDVEKRADKRPVISDLRESGGVEQDSDVVILLHRPDAYEPESPRAGEIDLIVGKNRSGPQATITAAFQGHYSRIADMAEEPWSPSRMAS